jgi:hypothetical protein
MAGKGIFDTKSYTVLYSGKEKSAHEAGVTFIVDKTIKRNVTKKDEFYQNLGKAYDAAPCQDWKG